MQSNQNLKWLREVMPTLLSLIVTVSFIVIAWNILFSKTMADSVLAGTIIGYLASKSDQVFNYYLGSTANSMKKTEMIAGKNTEADNEH